MMYGNIVFFPPIKEDKDKEFRMKSHFYEVVAL